MTLPYVYTFRRCPYAMRARMALAQSGIDFEIREILLKDKPEHMLSLSPKGTVPVLVLEDGEVIDESLDVMRWALSQNDPDGWMQYSDEEQQSVDALIQRNDDEFKSFLDRYKYSSRHPEKTMEEWRDGAMGFLSQLEEFLQKNPYLYGENISFADVAVFPFVRQFAHVDLTWFENAGFPQVFAWYQKILNSLCFTCVMKKYPLWKDGDAPICFRD